MQLSQDATTSAGRPSQEDGSLSMSYGGLMSLHGGVGGGLSLLEALVIVTQNERLSPDVLRYPQDLIDGALAALASQRKVVELAAERHQERLRRKLAGVSADDDDDEHDYSLPGAGTELLPMVIGASLQLPIQPHDVLRLEMTRLEFLVSELLRVRLQKIQQLCHRIHYLSDQYRLLMSPKEILMGDRFCALYENAVAQSAMNAVTVANANQRGTTVEVAARQYFTPNPSDNHLHQLQQRQSGGVGVMTPGSVMNQSQLSVATSGSHNPLPVPDKRARVFVCALEDLGAVDVGPNVTTTVTEGETLLTPLDIFEAALNQRKARLL